MRTEGLHVTADLWLNEFLLGNKEWVDLVTEALSLSGMTVLGKAIHNFSDKALTGVWLLAESHFSIHTFPERSYLSIDCYTCGDKGAPLAVVNKITSALDVKRCDIRAFTRGAGDG